MKRYINAEPLIYAVYFAPNGKERLLRLGEQLMHRHLTYDDRLIGVVGDAGSGKSLIIRGMFPGLELLNNDVGVNASSILNMRDTLDRNFDFSTYHFDMRFQMAFVQMFEIVDFVNSALEKGRRVIIEHFDLLYPHLKRNAHVLIGIGAEVMITRPTMFGPLPKDLYDIVFNSLKIRKMRHTAEDLVTLVLKMEFNNMNLQIINGDIRGGFTLGFEKPLDINLYELEERVQSLINIGMSVSYVDENSIRIGNYIMPCTSPRMHLRDISEIENLQLIKEMKYDPQNELYLIIGTVSNKSLDLSDLNRIGKEEAS